MNISFTPQLEESVNRKVASGSYHSASEVIREGLRLLQKKDELYMAHLAQLHKEIQIGLDQFERGEYTTYDEEGRKQLFEDIKSGGTGKYKK